MQNLAQLFNLAGGKLALVPNLCAKRSIGFNAGLLHNGISANTRIRDKLLKHRSVRHSHILLSAELNSPLPIYTIAESLSTYLQNFVEKISAMCYPRLG